MSSKKKMPTKTELLQLQKLYKTDEKIGERLGGVPAYLVAYWRRKKNIPKYSLPKFSETEIRNLWERYGDDEKCGLELGISKAAFYNWRRRYGIREKPAFLKLEQLEFNFPGSRISPHAATLYGKQTIVQKVLARVAGIEKCEPGQTVEVEPDLALVNGDVETVMTKFRQAGVEYVWNAGKIVLSTSQYATESGEVALSDDRDLREFLKRQGIRAFYDLREGAVNQVALERGHILPGMLALGTDPETVSCGAAGSLGLRINHERMADMWSRGKLEITVPDSTYVAVAGRRARGIYAKDIALYVMAKLAGNGSRQHALEFAGSVISQMSISERFSLATTASVLDVAGALCPYDATTRRYLTGRTMTAYKPVLPDKDAEYEHMFQISIDQLVAQIATGPDPVDTKAVRECEGTPVSAVVLGLAANGRFDDLRVAAEILKGNKVHPDCQLFVVPASRSVYLEALKKGLIRIFVETGGIVMPPDSGAYVHSLVAALPPGERILSTGGWVGAPSQKMNDGEYYIASPATAAASALSASVTDPMRFVK